MTQDVTHQADPAGPHGPASIPGSCTNTFAAVNAQIDALADTGLQDLQKRWLAIHGLEAPRRLGSDFLKRAIAFDLQEQQLGGLSRQAKLRLKTQEGRPPGAAGTGRGITVSSRVRAGTRFVREWQGETHEVQAVENGQFVYRGKLHRSLSVIAREITGTHQSGPRFFGIDRPTAKRLSTAESHG